MYGDLYGASVTLAKLDAHRASLLAGLHCSYPSVITMTDELTLSTPMAEAAGRILPTMLRTTVPLRFDGDADRAASHLAALGALRFPGVRSSFKKHVSLL